MRRSDRAVAAIVVVMAVLAIASLPTWLDRGFWAGVVIVAILLFAFWDAIVGKLPSMARGAVRGTLRVLMHPVVSMAILLGLLTAAFVTGNRDYLLVLFGAIAMLVPPKLRWQDLLDRPARAATRQAVDLMAQLEVLEGAPRSEPGFPNVVELTSQGTSRNTFVLSRNAVSRDMRVDFDALLRPGALLNVVLRFDPATVSGYMLRLDSRSSYRDSILVMRNGGWSSELHVSQWETPVDTWVHVVASAQGSRLELARDGVIVCTADDGNFTEGRVGFFNEVGDAAIRDVAVTAL